MTVSPPLLKDTFIPCDEDLRAACLWFGCPFIPDPAPPSEDEYEHFLEAELARGRP